MAHPTMPLMESLEGRRLLSVAALPYSITTAVHSDGVKETRFIFHGKQHFMSLIADHGTLVLRPHPGADINGWGSSLYLQPSLPGALLKGTKIPPVIVGKDGIEVKASGLVSQGAASSYGTWSADIVFKYDSVARRVLGSGHYTISLKARLTDKSGDLNLLKLASNYLNDVPRLDGTTGDTGDMKLVNIVEDHKTYTWIPENNPGFFPQDLTRSLSINVQGQYNNVDTKAQGYKPITPAYKPSLQVILTGPAMIFGGLYDTTQADKFYADNVGITPLVLHTSTQTKFTIGVGFESRALRNG